MISSKQNEHLCAVQHTDYGSYYVGRAEELLSGSLGSTLKSKVNLILTSPPFPLNKKKSYGNLNGEQYLTWFTGLAGLFSDLLAPNGSIVIEMGNAWESGRPIQSLLPLECLLGFVRNPKARLRLCQQFVCYNPARLPTPAEWVTIRRIRVTDSFTNIWWMANSDFPKADNQRVLRPYSSSMKDLLNAGDYNAGKRPSEHNISKSGFLKRHKGSIQPNMLELEALPGSSAVRLPSVMRIANTSSNDYFLRACRSQDIIPHPARLPVGLAAFFVKFLTEPGDIVLDPFAGSNTVGFISELQGRQWVAIDASGDYVEQSKIRFKNPILKSLR